MNDLEPYLLFSNILFSERGRNGQVDDNENAARTVGAGGAEWTETEHYEFASH